jgi:hypothetical protein
MEGFYHAARLEPREREGGVIFPRPRSRVGLSQGLRAATAGAQRRATYSSSSISRVVTVMVYV